MSSMKKEVCFTNALPTDKKIHPELPSTTKLRYPLGKAIVGHVAKNKRAELIQDTSKDSRYIIDDANRLSEICVPIFLGNRLFGVIDSEHPSANYYTEKHLHLLTIIAALCGHKIQELLNQEKKQATWDGSYFETLESLMKSEKIYRNPDLNLTSTAQLLGISACYLSSMINAISRKSFIDYINGYRLKDIKKNLHSEEYAHYTIVSIGLEAGFNSKSAFYYAFKKQTGLTPSRYRENSFLVSKPLFKD